MANSADMTHASMFGPNELSLFDPENLQELNLLRRHLSSPSDAAKVAASEIEHSNRTCANVSDADQIFDQLKSDDSRKDWEVGVLDIDIIHRGRIRIVIKEWPPVIMYCRNDLTENNIVKQFRLHVLRNSHDITLVYGTYRFKQKIYKTWLKDYHCGKIIDATKNIQETMVNLAYWLTAQPHAEKNYSTWEVLIEEAMTKLRGASDPKEAE